MKKQIFLALGLFTAALTAGEVESVVAPYGISQAISNLTADFEGYTAADGLTQLGLQFWVPDSSGGIGYIRDYGTITDDQVNTFVNWGKENDVKIHLDLFNATGGHWDWDLASYAFTNHKRELINSILSEVEKFDFAGVRIDLEAMDFSINNVTGDTIIYTEEFLSSTRPAYTEFVNELADSLHAREKKIAVATLAGIWGAPNRNWWGDWAGKIDDIISMGFHDAYEGQTFGQFSLTYSGQQAEIVALGYEPHQITHCMPMDRAEWGSGGLGTSGADHVRECLSLETPAGVLIFEMRLTDPHWRSAEVWSQMAARKEELSTPSAIQSEAPKSVSTPFVIDGNSLKFNKFHNNNSVKIYSVNGQLLKEISGIETDISLNTLGLAKGIYQMRVVQGADVFTGQFVLR